MIFDQEDHQKQSPMNVEQTTQKERTETITINEGGSETFKDSSLYDAGVFKVL